MESSPTTQEIKLGDASIALSENSLGMRMRVRQPVSAVDSENVELFKETRTDKDSKNIETNAPMVDATVLMFPIPEGSKMDLEDIPGDPFRSGESPTPVHSGSNDKNVELDEEKSIEPAIAPPGHVENIVNKAVPVYAVGMGSLLIASVIGCIAKGIFKRYS